MAQPTSSQETVCKDLALLSLGVPSISTQAKAEAISTKPSCNVAFQTNDIKHQREPTNYNTNVPLSTNFTLPIRPAPKPTPLTEQNATPRQVLFTPAESYKLPPSFMYPITLPIAAGLPQNDRPCRFPLAAPTTQSLVHPPGSQVASTRKRRPRRRDRHQQDPGPKVRGLITQLVNAK